MRDSPPVGPPQGRDRFDRTLGTGQASRRAGAPRSHGGFTGARHTGIGTFPLESNSVQRHLIAIASATRARAGAGPTAGS
jgi:hypothetical protein